MALATWRVFGGLQSFGEVDVDVRYDDVTTVIQDVLATATADQGQTVPPTLVVKGTLTDNQTQRTLTFTLTPGTPSLVSGNVQLAVAQTQTRRGGRYSYNFAPIW